MRDVTDARFHYASLLAELRRRGKQFPREDKEQLIEEELASRGGLIYPTFTHFAASMNPRIGDRPGIVEYEHVPKLLDVAERVVSGVLKHVMVLISPRYLKSEVFSRLLPAYYLLKNPKNSFALASHEASLAWELSEAARENFVAGHGKLSPETTAKERWQTSRQGTMLAAGMGGRMMGRGFNLGVVDDPISPQHTFSFARRLTFTRWWENTWLRAREPGAQMIFVMQRLGVEDPIDYLFRREVGEREVASPLYWHVVALDEVKSMEPYGRWSGPMGLPPTCTIEPDHRPVGKVLAPTRFSEAEVKQRQAQNPYVTAAQRQQRPMMPTGDFWRLRWFEDRTYKELPKDAYNGGRDWDTAMTDKEHNSATANVLTFRGPPIPGRDGEFYVYVEDVDWRWLEFPGLVEWMRSVKGPHYVEAKASGKSAVQSLLAFNIRAEEVPVKGDKLKRASGVQAAVSSGRVYVNEAIITKLLYGEGQGLLRITAEGLQNDGEGLDMNDAFVQALHRHLGIDSDAITIQFR